MKKATLTRLILYAASGIILAVTFSSCNFLLQMAQVRFNNQSSDTFTSVTFGNISQGTLTAGLDNIVPVDRFWHIYPEH